MLTKVMIHSNRKSATLYYDGREPLGLIASTPQGLVELLRTMGVEISARRAS